MSAILRRRDVRLSSMLRWFGSPSNCIVVHIFKPTPRHPNNSPSLHNTTPQQAIPKRSVCTKYAIIPRHSCTGYTRFSFFQPSKSPRGFNPRGSPLCHNFPLFITLCPSPPSLSPLPTIHSLTYHLFHTSNHRITTHTLHLAEKSRAHQLKACLPACLPCPRAPLSDPDYRGRSSSLNK